VLNGIVNKKRLPDIFQQPFLGFSAKLLFHHSGCPNFLTIMNAQYVGARTKAQKRKLNFLTVFLVGLNP
jgi:hypothetical protein